VLGVGDVMFWIGQRVVSKWRLSICATSTTGLIRLGSPGNQSLKNRRAQIFADVKLSF
jgi:hypothetical protein